VFVNTQSLRTTSINAAEPKPKLLAYSATKAAIVNFTGGLAQLLAEKVIRLGYSDDEIRALGEVGI
jgi:short-subunit dehydrogenase